MSTPSISFRQLFMLDPSIHFLNHGSFGACPIPVFTEYQNWQKKLENQPVKFLARDFAMYDQVTRLHLSEYLHSASSNLSFIQNATQGVNIIARSLKLQSNDEILSTDHEYGACEYAWEFACQQTGAHYIKHKIPLPAKSEQELFDQFWQGVSARTKVIYLSHITSPTALCFPLKTICAKARNLGILTVVDGAHAPGQIPLDLDDLSPDFYVGNCHKWMLGPKGAGFLYARPEVQEMIQPLVVSWGYHASTDSTTGSQFLDFLQWTGTRDPSAVFSIPAAIKFMQDYDWPTVQSQCHALLTQAIDQICDLTQLESLYPFGSNLYHQMGVAPLPKWVDLDDLKSKLYSEFKVEVPLIEWNNRKLVRISIQAYNTQEDCDALLQGISYLLSSQGKNQRL